MKPAVDEMFPEGAGPYVDLDEVGLRQYEAGRGGREHGSQARAEAQALAESKAAGSWGSGSWW